MWRSKPSLEPFTSSTVSYTTASIVPENIAKKTPRASALRMYVGTSRLSLPFNS